MARVATFKVGDKVLFKSYTGYIKCVVREVDVTCHLFKPDDRVFYRVEGGVISICTDKYLRLENE